LAYDRYGGRSGKYAHLGRPASRDDSRYARNSRGRGYGYNSRGYSRQQPYREPGFSDEEHQLFNVVSGSSGSGFHLELPSFSFGKVLDRDFERKKLFLLVSCILFILAMLVFAKTNIHLVDILDVARIKFNFVKLWSPYFLLFTAIFSLAIASTIFFAHRLRDGQAVLMLPIGIVISAVLSLLFYPGLLIPFAVLSVVLGIAGLLSARMGPNLPDIKSLWFAVSASLVALLFLTACFGYYEFSSHKDEYTNRLIEDSYSYLWDSGAQNRLSDACLSMLVSSGVSTVDASMLQVTISRNDSIAFLNASIPGFDGKSEAEKNSLIEAYELNLRKGLGEALKGVSIDSSSLALQVPQQKPEFTDEMRESALEAIRGNEQSKFAYDSFPLLATVALVSGVLVFSIFVLLLSTAFSLLAFDRLR